MKARHKRLGLIFMLISGLSIMSVLILQAVNSSMVFFYSPSQVHDGEAGIDRTFRLGGLVGENSFKREGDGLTVHFQVTDKVKMVPVKYVGMLPDLFREGQGVVTQGRMGDDGVFLANEVLAKHDEEYMAPEVADALAQAKQSQLDNMPDKQI